MARRYEDILTQKTLSGKVAYLPTIYPSVTLSNQDYYIVAREQDRMDLLANDFYGDPSLWWVIAMANDIEALFRLHIRYRRGGAVLMPFRLNLHLM